jgi:hypothetical protein
MTLLNHEDGGNVLHEMWLNLHWTAWQHILDDSILNKNLCSWDVSVTVSVFSGSFNKVQIVWNPASIYRRLLYTGMELCCLL